MREHTACYPAAPVPYRFPMGLIISTGASKVILLTDLDWQSLQEDTEDREKCTNICLVTRHLQV